MGNHGGKNNNTPMADVAKLLELWIVVPVPISNINDLSPKTIGTSEDITSK